MRERGTRAPPGAVRLIALLLHALPLTAQDTLVVRADNPPVWGAAPRLVEELRIGVLEGDPRYQFGHIADILELPNGDIWVADRFADVIRRYSRAGMHLGDVGREGQGPGEFVWIDGMRLLPDGRVAVLDNDNGRVELFDGGGQLTGSHRSPGAGVHAFPQPLEVDTAGALYVKGAHMLRGGIPVPPPYASNSAGITLRWFWVRLSGSGDVTDTVFGPAQPREGLSGTQSSVSPLGYVLHGRTDEYAFDRPLRDGRTARIERSWTAVPYDPAEREELQARFDFARGDVEVPRTKLPWSTFWLDAEGRIWIERNVPAEKMPESERDEGPRSPGFPGMPTGPFPPITWWQPVTYDVIEPTGRFLGTVIVPGAWSRPFNTDAPKLAFARGSTLWTIEKGELDEQYVVKYRIMPGP